MGRSPRLRRRYSEDGTVAAPAIRVIPTPFHDVLALLHSPALRAVEQAIVAKTGSRIVEDYSVTRTSMTQADLSVSGMTVAEAESLLITHRDRIIAFGVALAPDDSTDHDGEFPEDEEQDASEPVEVLGMAVGFSVGLAITYNFLANRTASDYLAYLKNRLVPHQARTARELRRVFDAIR